MTAPQLQTPGSFAALGDGFYTRVAPWGLPKPYWVASSPSAAAELGLSEAWMRSDEALQAFAGNALLGGSQPLASVYSGHQFGVWAGQLGDGRALLLGETSGGIELQLKGAGATPYSRMGDGRAVLRSSVREFLCSEAMHALGVPTTRALALVGSAQPVRRETLETAAVVARTAPSFVRFGHFEHFSYGGDTPRLRALADHVIARFYPECQASANPYAALLEAVSARTATLLAHWQTLGFCHGVMNTDNMSILGLTIDYGPFGFLDGFNPRHICNHTDTQGRYAYAQQPNIAYWNLFCLGQALMPLIADDQSDAQTLAVAALEPYKTLYPAALQQRFAAKLGFAEPTAQTPGLVDALLRLMAAEQTDWTLFWRTLSEELAAPQGAAPSGQPRAATRDLFQDRAAFDAWMLQFTEQTNTTGTGHMPDLMLKSNPKVVLRNHLAQTAIQAAEQGDFAPLHELHTVLSTPFEALAGMQAYSALPPDWAQGLEVSCSS